MTPPLACRVLPLLAAVVVPLAILVNEVMLGR